MNTAPGLHDSNNEQQLDSFDPAQRKAALERLAPTDGTRGAAGMRQPGGNELFNMHIHSFFSYNANGHSPSRIAWEAHKAGLYSAALCDFDVLDGLEEFLEAGFLLGLRTAVHLETRAFLSRYASADINSPGEPGVTYIMGSGFSRIPEPGTPESAGLARLRQSANERNQALVRRINSRLPDIAIDYEREVVLLSPGGCPTERHIVRAYRIMAESVFGVGPRLFEFWSGLMKRDTETIKSMCRNIPVMEDAIRAVLSKSGGVGYEQPTGDTFPPAGDFIKWTLSCGAIPTITWLDGTSDGEANTSEMFEHMRAMGACALNIIPDRNHNIADPSVRTLKLRKLDEAVREARRLELPINIGTEMNKAGQPFADDTRCEALRSYHGDFLRGTRIMVGQTLLSRYCGFSYTGAAAEAEFGPDIAGKNDFFESIGSLPPLTKREAHKLEEAGPEKALGLIRGDAAKKSIEGARGI